MSFKNIIGQEKAVELLLKSLKEDKIFPSYIFMGADGVGKKYTAIEFAKAINCLNLSNDFEVCEKCSSCNKINKVCSPDLKIIEPIKGSIRIEQIRELRREINLKPFENRKKIYIIDHAEAMTLEASNCLLKTIEEPPDYAIMILICSKLDSVLPTIVSRCQLIKFKLIGYLEIMEVVLSNKVDIEKDKAKLISKLAQGSISKALKLISDKEYFKRREKILDYLTLILPGKYNDNLFTNMEQILTEMNKTEETLDIILFWYYDILLVKELGIQEYIKNIDKLKIIKEKSKVYSREMLIDILDYIEQIQEFMKRNINKHLILERLY
ncbi:MAG TPA: DNA polymerase III subunit, partial [Candidatus Atribacteria bacterium]|nr:DNA polymerase III subunit [Candidatus Atribacteria bacterium]